jgi:hypothetical protein
MIDIEAMHLTRDEVARDPGCRLCSQIPEPRPKSATHV